MKLLKLLFLIIALGLAGCANVPQPPGFVQPTRIDDPGPKFASIEPRSADYTDVLTAQGQQRILFSSLTNDAVNKMLPLERSFASVLKVTGSGEASFVSSRATAEAGLYKVVLDYAKYRDDTMANENIPVRVGVGVRIIADIRTAAANVDLSGIFAIAYAAKAGLISGKIEVIKIGIDSPGLNLVLPPPTDLSDGALQNALQAVAAIRAKMYDNSTTLVPHILAVQVKAENRPR